MPCARGGGECQDCGGNTMTLIESEGRRICATCFGQERLSRPSPMLQFIERQETGSCDLIRDLFKFQVKHLSKADYAEIVEFLEEPTTGYSSSTPKNVLTIARVSGSHDAHISLASEWGRISDQSFVVLTVPDYDLSNEEANFILGADFLEFLCLGCQWGFSDLDNITTEFDAVCDQIENGPEDETDYDPDHLEALEALRAEFGLVPWGNARSRFEALRSTYGSALRFHHRSS